MHSVHNTQFAIVALFFFSFVFSLLINYILLKFAKTLGIRSKSQNEIRWSPNYKPSLGGISFYMSFLFSFVFLVLLNPDFNSIKWQAFGILLSASLAFLMGLSDDAFNTQPLLKLITQIVCALILIYSGIFIQIFQDDLINYSLTIFWVVGLMNAFNLLDNMDGITGVISLVISMFFIVVTLALKHNNHYITIFGICLAGALIGFLFYNFHPSRLFMGDSGSQFIGSILSTIGIEVCWNNSYIYYSELAPERNICVVLLVFILPLTDTTTVFINRMLAGKSPFIGGKDHTTHHLFFRGITEKRIAVLYFLITVIASIIAYNIIFHYSKIVLITGYLFVAVVFLFLYLNTIIKKS